MTLEQIQKDFIEAIFGGDKSSAASHVLGDERLTAEQRFGIYSGSVHGILSKSLGITFPVCKQLVGDKFFNNMAKIFIDQYPPTTFLFSDYGNNFPVFLDSFEHIKDLPYLPDVTRLEWARYKVWHEQVITQMDYSKLSQLAPDKQASLKFFLTNTLHLIESPYRIDDIWFSHQKESDVKLENISINEPSKLFVWKDNETVKISLMSNDEGSSLFWDFLNTISKGLTLERLAEQFGEKLPDLLEQGFKGNWIRSFTTTK